MKIAISATALTLDAEVDPRFGRSQYFIIVDPDTMEFESLENPNVTAAGGAGISTAQMIANKGVQVVLTGNCGPNAYQVLSAAGLQVITGVSGRIRDAIQAYKSGQLQSASQSTVDAHFGRGMGGGRGKGMGRGMSGGMMPITGPAPQPASPEQELEALKTETRTLAQQLEDMQRRIKELESQK